MAFNEGFDGRWTAAQNFSPNRLVLFIKDEIYQFVAPSGNLFTQFSSDFLRGSSLPIPVKNWILEGTESKPNLRVRATRRADTMVRLALSSDPSSRREFIIFGVCIPGEKGYLITQVLPVAHPITGKPRVLTPHEAKNRENLEDFIEAIGPFVLTRSVMHFAEQAANN